MLTAEETQKVESIDIGAIASILGISPSAIKIGEVESHNGVYRLP